MPKIPNILKNDVERIADPSAHGDPTIRLAHVPGAQGDNNLLGQRGVPILPVESRPALLVSFVYLGGFMANIERYAFRDWAMDSGAFTAHSAGIEINLQSYIDCAKELLARPEVKLTEVFALDVIGDWRASLRNTEEMWRQGIEAVPCFHNGEPWDVLIEMAKNYPKVALGGLIAQRMSMNVRKKWLDQCFARTWPKKIHGFGLSSERYVLAYPFHSVDSTDWEIKPCRFGHWRAFGHMGSTKYMNVKGSNQNLRAEVEWYLELERRARTKWRREMGLLGEAAGSSSPSVRLVAGTGRSVKDVGIEALGPQG